MIENAVAAAEREDWPACLTALLAAWRPHREPAIAELIDRVSAHIRVPAIRPDMRAIETHIPVATDAEVSALVTAIATKVGTYPPAMQLGLALAKAREPDPRIATLLASFAPFRSLKNLVDLLIVEALATIDDPRHRNVIVHFAEMLVPRRAGLTKGRDRIDALVGICARVSARPPPPTSGLLVARIRAIDTALARPTPTSATATDRATLLNAVYSRPDDTTARLVYADVLQDAGDPRGEFITLQCSRDPGSRPGRRENELRKTHEQLWLDGLGPYLFKQGLVYRRGFLAEARLATRSFTTAPTERAWHTLEKLDVTECSGPIFSGWLPTLRGLRHVARIGDDDVPFIAAHGPVAWTELGLSYPSAASLALLGKQAAKFPQLRTLDLTASFSIDAGSIVQFAPLRLARLRIGLSVVFHHDGGRWIPQLSTDRSTIAQYLRAAQRIGIPALELVPANTMSLTISGTHATVAIPAKVSDEYVTLLLDALPAGTITTLSSNRALPETMLESRQITASPDASSRAT